MFAPLISASPFLPEPSSIESHANGQLGGSAKAAADLVKQLKGEIIGYLFILEIPGLDGRKKLGDIPTVIMLEDA